MALLGAAFDAVTLSQAVDCISRFIASGVPHQVVTANVDFLAQAQRDAELQRILAEAHLTVCDGLPLVWASRLFNHPLPERVAGADLVPRLLERAADCGHRVYFLGSTPDACRQAVTNAQAQIPRLTIAGYDAPPIAPLDAMDHAAIVGRIRQARPDLLLVAFGCPKAEKWIARNLQKLNVPVCMGVGATLDFLAGRVKRAPVWIQRCGGEWLYRLAQEPRRLFRRYASDLTFYASATAKQWWATQAGMDPLPSCAPRAAFFQERNCRRIHLSGRLNASLLRTETRLWTEDFHQPCLVELTDVRFMDSAGLGWLLWLRRGLTWQRQPLFLVDPSLPIRQALDLLRLEALFTTVAAGVEAHERLDRAS